MATSAKWSRTSHGVAVLSLALGGLFLLFTTVMMSDAGFDVTDEGFYLHWIRNPWVYSASATQFGFVYHGLFELVSGSIALLRQANFILTYVLATLFGFFIMRDLLPSESRRSQLLCALGFAGTAFAFPTSWLVTPSYNSLILQGACIIGISFYLIRAPAKPARIAGGILLGLGGVLTFQAKPTAAAAFAVLALFFLIYERRRVLSPLVAAVLSSVVGLLLFAYYIDGSVISYTRRLINGAHTMGLLEAKHTIHDLFRIDPIQTTRLENMALGILIFGALIWIATSTRLRRFGELCGASFSALAVLILILWQPGLDGDLISAWEFGYLRLTPTIAFAGAALLALFIQRLRRRPLNRARESLFWGSLFLLFPIASSFGTNNNIWGAASQYAIFWIAAGLCYARPLFSEGREATGLVPLTALAVAYVGFTLQLGISSPYRQTASLEHATQIVDLGNDGGRLRLTSNFANYFEKGRSLARQSGFPPGGWILDFSGRSPGYVYILGGKSPGTAWWIGGYPGTVAMITHSLKDVPCETLLSAWILAEPGSPATLDPQILRAFAATENDYESMGELIPATGWGLPQFLMRPKAELGTRLEACRQAKEALR